MWIFERVQPRWVGGGTLPGARSCACGELVGEDKRKALFPGRTVDRRVPVGPEPHTVLQPLRAPFRL